MNRRTKEFAEEVSELLCLFRDLAINGAEKKNLSPYDVEIELEYALTIHKTRRMIATDMCVQRHFDNLKERSLFKFCGTHDCEKIKLNPEFADKEVDLMVSRVRMPKNEIVV